MENLEIKHYPIRIILNSLEQLKKLPQGVYYIEVINSEEEFFSAIPKDMRKYCLLEKKNNNTFDSFLKLTTSSDLSEYNGFLNSNGSLIAFKKVTI